MKKTYIPSTPRSRKLRSVGGGTINVSGGSTQSVPVIEGHTHDNKIILDAITQLHLRILSSLNVDENGALIVELSNIIKELDTTVPTDENLFSALRTVLEIRARSISKTDPDTAQEIITFLKGIIASGTSKFDNIEVGNYTTGPLGAGAAIKMENGVSRLEVDNLDVRMRATFRELIIESLKHIGGQLILSPARMKCNKVVDGGTYYRCYFDTGDGKVSNEFVAGDQARCQVFTGSGVKMYWRLVTSVGADWINLSKTDAISGSSIPEAGDDIVQLGHRTDTTRQNAQILSTVGSDAPSWKQYKGINAFSLEGKDTTVFSGTGNKIDGKTVFMSSGANVEDGINSKNSNYSSQPTSYKANDTWTLSADTTVNGTLYKKGFVLTATQDSQTFNEVHWVKRDAYTDDTAVENLQIGTRNFYHSNTITENYDVVLYEKTERGFEGIGNLEGNFPNATIRIRPIITNGVWTLKFKAKSNANVAMRCDMCDLEINTFNLTTEWQIFEFTQNIINYSNIYNFIDFVLPDYAWYYIDDIVVVQGNKAPSSFIEAPEDVQAKIDAAKQEALDAAGNAQTSANNANTAVGDLNTYVDGSFKDGVIEASEAKAIEKYINVVNTEKSNLEATYNTLYANTYLEGTAKTTMLNTKVTYFGAVDTLLNSINTAVADGKTTIAEKQAVDTNYSSYKTALASLQSAIEEANKAIQTRLDTLSTEKVDNLRIGVRNFFKKTTPLSAYWQVPPYTDTSDRIEKTDSGFNYTGVPESLSDVRANYVITGNGEWTVSFEIQSNAAGYPFYVDVCDLGETEFYTPSVVGEWEKCALTVNVTNYGDGSVYNFVDFSDIQYLVFNVRNLMVVQGNKAPESWIEAPEDIQARIDAVNATASDAQAKANVSKAITDTFKTTINGGLISTVLILLRELNSIIETAGISGIQGDGYSPSYWSGGTYSQALAFSNLAIALDSGVTPIPSATLNATMANIVHLHNGIAKIGKLIIGSNGNIYTLKNGIVRFELNANSLPYISSLRDQSEINRTANNTSKSFTINSEEYIFPNSIEVVEDNSTVTVQAQISATAFSDDNPPVNYSTSVFLYLINSDGSTYSTVGFVYAATNSTDTFDVNSKITGVAKGFYKLKAIYTNSSGHYAASGSVGASVMTSQFKVDVSKFMIGENGYMGFYGKNKYIYFNENEDIFFGLRGATDMPGVLLSATVASSGGWSSVWGAKQSTTPPYKNSTGKYTVYHTLGHSNYQVYASPHSASRSYHIVSKEPTSFVIEWRTIGSTPSLSDTTFDVEMVGKNYV